MTKLIAAANFSKRVVYDRETGVVTWLQRIVRTGDHKAWNTKFAGRPAGGLTNKGYLIVALREEGRVYNIFLHQLIWYIEYGVLPSGVIDHINQNKTDNRIENLRDISQRDNTRNAKLNAKNTTGYTGVQVASRGRGFVARGRLPNGKECSLGTFATAEEAGVVAREYRLSLGFSQLHGSPRNSGVMK